MAGELGIDDKIVYIKSIAEKIMGNSFDHGYPHVMRVLRNAHEIVEKERLEIDIKALDIAVILHDVGRMVGEPHAYYSALIARSLLTLHGFSKDFVEKVDNAIQYHSYSYSREHGIKPLSIEAMVLSDADKLDALGVVGFIRVFTFNPDRGLDDIIKHFYEKILKLPELMHFNYSREKAIILRDRVLKMLEWLDDETG